jgi:hypothetical protein
VREALLAELYAAIRRDDRVAVALLRDQLVAVELGHAPSAVN